ncbi:MAG: peptidoglycan bridge formation glycyltransferase FemA/FemB family protein [Candidatus Peribacteraceae bacterium]|jgi:lipid II:glycine glycyltransferase (peptidoglycan interpeptide bridge formation enzyme)|nr:peptidoglycan bridge formation glycyltransferase FemA/FemB family protein [Candidatus Peribacteraceae bacterium]
MHTCLLSTAEDLAVYDRFVRHHPQGNLWQSLEWQKYQETLGRETRIYALMEGTHILASALVVIDRTALGFSTWDIPRGPIWDLGLRTEDLGHFMETISSDAKMGRCLSLYFSPLHLFPSPKSPVLSPSPRHEQPSATRIIDLTRPEADILKQMKPKGRYNITVADKHGVHVEQSEDISAFMGLLKKTGQRDNFTIHSARHYVTFLKELPGSFLFLAWASQTPTPVPSPNGGGGSRRGGVGDEIPIAGLLGVIWGSKAFYYYGASSYEHRALMAPYALQWAAMRHTKAAGCTTYDLLGIAPPDAPSNHPWQGVSAFKEKFGGTVAPYPPEQEIVLRPMASRLLQLKRKLFG